MDLLAECLSISRIEPGETIVQDRRRAAASVARRVPRAPAETRARRSPPPQEGEQGTWIGILLRGGLEVIIGGKPVFHVDPGNFVGEMILWAGGVRQVSHTPPPPCSYAPAWLTGRVPGVFVAQASVRASGEGVIATILVSELQAPYLSHSTRRLIMAMHPAHLGDLSRPCMSLRNSRWSTRLLLSGCSKVRADSRCAPSST